MLQQFLFEPEVQRFFVILWACGYWLLATALYLGDHVGGAQTVGFLSWRSLTVSQCCWLYMFVKPFCQGGKKRFHFTLLQRYLGTELSAGAIVTFLVSPMGSDG